MIVLSVDIGWRHLAYALLDLTESSIIINKWKIVDIIEDELINVNETTTDVLISKSAKILGCLVKEWALCNPEIAYLENQPLGQMARNVKTKTLSHVMQALLIAEGIKVQFVSPKKKLAGMQDCGSYSDNKKFAVASTLKVLSEYNLLEWINWFDAVKGKKDDLADSFLQGVYAGRSTLRENKKIKKNTEGVSKKTVKRKRNAHTDTELLLKSELDLV